MTASELKAAFPTAVLMPRKTEVAHRADGVLTALAGLVRVNRGKAVSHAKLLDAMREIVMRGLAWGQELE